MNIYKAKKSNLLIWLMAALLVLPLLLFWFDNKTISEKPFLLLPLLTPLTLVLWLYFDTYYIIGDRKLIYRSGFIRGKIDIHKIVEIRKNKTMWTGLKPALATNGIIIKYEKYNEIYLAPLDHEEFITDLVRKNKSILVRE